MEIVICVLVYVLASYVVTWALLLRLNTIGGEAPPPQDLGRIFFLISPLPLVWALLLVVWLDSERPNVQMWVIRTWNRFCERIGI